MRNSRGFTLVEILVALFIFAIIGFLAAASLHTVIRLHHELKKTDKQVLQLEFTMTLLRRDTMQAIDRPIRDSDGNPESAFVCDGSNSLIFTRTGLIDPFNSSRLSTMQRIGYVLSGTQLVRLTWDVLDQPPHSRPEKQVLLDGVTSIHWQFRTRNNITSNSWPPVVGTNMQRENTDLPRAVLLLMHLKNGGVVEGVFPVPSSGVQLNAQSP